VHEAPFADVQRDVRERPAERVEEQQIAGLQRLRPHGVADPAHLVGAPWQIQAERQPDRLPHEPAAVESPLRIVAAHPIRNAEKAQRAHHDLGTERRRGGTFLRERNRAMRDRDRDARTDQSAAHAGQRGVADG
jgi:hypothetical protein